MGQGLPSLMMKRLAEVWSAVRMSSVRSRSVSRSRIRWSLSMMEFGPCSAR